jgi:aminoglycoside/choline kinase family phosphotransferase
VDAFVDIGRHLHASGACVPAIYLHDTFSGLVFLEDLGTCHLQQAAQALPPMAQEDLYRQVIDLWLHMALESAHHFDTGWTYQSTHYSRELILERECRYFVEAFFKGYLGLTVSEETLSGEFDLLAELALQNSVTGFMHRDLQSRNIMVRDKRIGFIDFQGGRLGPLQYDLASLLIDPYIALPEAMQQRLAQYAAQALQRLAGVEPGNFLQGYDYCALTRNLQMLGAFGFLSRVKGKRRFEIYIPRAVATLQRRLNGPAGIRLPRLTAMAAQIVQHLARITDPK